MISLPRQTLKQRPDGRYACRYKGKFFYGATQSEALAAREAYKRMEEQGLRKESQEITLSAYVARWLPAYHAEASAKQYNQYAKIVDRLCENLGSRKMSDITATDIQTFFSGLIGLSDSYIKKHKSTVKGIFSAAVDDGIILRSPYASSIKIPKGPTGSHRAIEPWERDIVHQLAQTHRFGIGAMLMLYGGLRRGEALAFDIDRDVDFANNRIYVRESVSFDDTNQGHLKRPKTAAGMRDLPLFRPLRDVLIGRRGKAVNSARGGIITNQAFRSMWRSYLSEASTIHNGGRCKRWAGRTNADKAAIENGQEPAEWVPVSMQPYDLRHSFCTMLYDAGVDIKTAMKWMGHADEKMILKIYAHLTAQKEKAAESAVAAEVDKILNGSQNGSQSDCGAKNIV